MSELSPRMNWTYPSRDEDPWWERFVDFVRSMDASGFASREDRNVILSGGGTLTWNVGVGLTWTEPFQVFSPSTGFFTYIAPSTALVAEGEVIRFDIVRSPGQNNTVAAVVAPFAENNDNSLLLGMRVGDYFYFRSGQAIADGTTIVSDDFFSGGGGGGGGGLGLTVVHAVATTFTAAAGNLYVLLPTSDFFTPGGTITLPTVLNDGDLIGLTIADMGEGVSNSQNGRAIVDGDGNTIRLGIGRTGTSVPINLNHGLLYLRWNAATSEWEVFGTEKLPNVYDLEMANTSYGAASFTLDWPNFSYQYDGTVAGTISLPASPRFGDLVQLRERSAGSAASVAAKVISGNGNTIFTPSAGGAPVASFTIRSKGSTVTLRFAFQWHVVGGAHDILLSNSTNEVLSSDGSGRVVLTALGMSPNLFDANSVLKADVDNTPVVQAMATNTLLARQAASISDMAVGLQSFVARAAANLTAIGVSDSRFVGRPTGGDLGEMTAAQAFAVMFSGQAQVDGTASTSDATPTTVFTYATLADERVVKFDISVVGREAATEDLASFNMVGLANRDNASVVTILDEAIQVYKSAGAAAWSLSLVVSGTDILVQVVGEAAHDIEWRVVGRVFEHGA